MSKLAVALGGFFILMGVWVAVFPEQLLSIADWESREGLYIAAAMRIVTGIVLIAAAPASRFPTGLRIFGAVVLLAGLGLLALPTDLWVGLIRWWTIDHFPLYHVAASAVGILVGAFIIFAALPKRPEC
jgi:hypothetical protein